jgi:hypothetical protein
MYILTPHGVEEKSKTTIRFFLKRKMKEFENIKKQIMEIRKEVGNNSKGIYKNIEIRVIPNNTSSKRNLPHVTYPHPKGMEHYGHIKTDNFQETLTTFDAIHPRRKQRGIVAWFRKW